MFWNLSIHLLKNTIIPEEMAGCVLAHCTWSSLIGLSLPQPITALPSFIIFNPSSFYASTELTCVVISNSTFTFVIFQYHRHSPPSAFQISTELNALLLSCFCRSMDNPTHIHRMMLRFRPIAPKPVGDDSPSAAPDQKYATDLTGGRRVKRKYVRSSRGRQSRRRPRTKFPDGGNLPSPPANSGVEDAPPPEKGALTLQLLGDRSEGERKICDKSQEENWKKADRCRVDHMTTAAYDGRTAETNGGGSVIETWIVIESVTDKFAGVGLGFSDREKISNLERDTCPGFVSDLTNNVVWVNPAYMKMVAEDEAAAAAVAEKGFRVWLVVKEEIPQICPSFACRVRVTQQKGQGQKWKKVAPCDVWRMEFGGFAWKLDVNTALTLGF